MSTQCSTEYGEGPEELRRQIADLTSDLAWERLRSAEWQRACIETTAKALEVIAEVKQAALAYIELCDGRRGVKLSD